MPRVARKNITASYIHVITQGIRKEYIFMKDEYKNEYIKLLQEIFQKYNNLYLLCYCIMDNHAHLLIYTEYSTQLSKAMARINTSYGIFYNKREERVGYVFRNRYYTQAIKDQEHLYNAVAYIHSNPVKAKMVKEKEEYLYSSYCQYQKGTMDKHCVELLFQTQKYHELFDVIHKYFEEEDIFDIDESKANKEEMEDFLKKFCERMEVKREEIRKSDYLIMQITELLKDKYSCTNKEISEMLGIGKNRIANIIKKQKRD